MKKPKRPFPDELMFLKNRKAKQATTNASLEGKVCVITGATSGVGYEALKRLAQSGAQLYFIARNVTKANQVQAELREKYHCESTYFIADFANLEAVKEVASTLLSQVPKIDVLINCAGLHSTKKTWTSDGYETVFAVNHLASFLFTMLLLPRMKESAPSRILQINSEGHRFNGLDPNDLDWRKRRYTGLKGYGASKTAQLMTVWELNDQLIDSGVTINAMHPGDVRTNIGQNNGWLYRTFSKFFIMPFLKDPAISGEAIYYLAAEPSLATTSGKFFHLTIEEKPAKHALDRVVGARIYKQSKIMVGLSE